MNANAKWQEQEGSETGWFQRAIYEPTLLDERLEPDLRNGRYPLVFLSGTPGSGKTQFLKKLSRALCDHGYCPADAPQSKVAAFRKNGATLYIKHDATQVESEFEDAAEKLAELLRHDWADATFDGRPKSASYIVGVNSGVLQRLCDADGFGKLGRVIRAGGDERVLMVDLSRRSPVSPPDCRDALVTRLLLNLTQKQYWENAPLGAPPRDTCWGCELAAGNLCPVLVNVQWLREDRCINRIHELFELAHHIAGNVVTFRDTLAILAKAIAGYADYYGDQGPCDAIRAEAASTGLVERLNLSRLLLYNNLFSDEDPYREYVSTARESDPEPRQHRFFGYSGPYFVADPGERGFMALLDPSESDCDELRVLDDEVFNFPDSLLANSSAHLEGLVFAAIRDRLTQLASTTTETEAGRLQRLREREWLLFCLTRLARRRRSLLGETSNKGMTRFGHARSFCEAIRGLATQAGGAGSRQLAGDIKAALTAFSGGASGGGIAVSYNAHDAEVRARLIFDIRLDVSLHNPPGPYVEYCPREISVVAWDPDPTQARVPLGRIDIDMAVWECLQRVATGHDPSFAGIDQVKAVEGFLLGLKARAWRQQGAKLVVEHADTQLTIGRDGEQLVIS